MERPAYAEEKVSHMGASVPKDGGDILAAD